ncbi:MAG: hypothetical protein WCO98_12305 [bacterium]
MKFRSIMTSFILSAVICVLAISAIAGNTVLPVPPVKSTSPAKSAQPAKPAPPAKPSVVPIPTQPKEPSVIILNKNTNMVCPVVDGLCNGQITNINNGTIEMFSLMPVEDKNLVVNIGYGTVISRENIGELFSFAGRNYIRQTSPDAAPKLISTYQNVRTPLSVGLYNHSIISPRVFRVSYSNPVLLQALMNKAVQDINEPVMVLGWVDMPEMNGEALKKAPIDGVSLNGDKRGDYIESVSGQNLRVIFSALAVPDKPKQSISSALFLDKIFNVNPQLKGNPGQTNTVIFAKAAITEDPIPDNYNTSPLVLSKMNVANVKDICTLLPTSTISKGILIFYQPKLKVLAPAK